jgi:predicted amidophosphoribosyltransferase
MDGHGTVKPVSVSGWLCPRCQRWHTGERLICDKCELAIEREAQKYSEDIMEEQLSERKE